MLAAGPLFTGTYSYAAGFATLLATLAALQSGRISIAVGCAALTLGFSPLAFVFLVLVLAAVVVARRQHRPPGGAVRDRAHRGCAGSSSSRCGCSRPVAAIRSAASSWRPCSWSPASASLIASRAPQGGVLAGLFGFWLLASVALYLVPEPVGENVTRLRSVVFPLMLLTVLLARFRPRRLAMVGLALALAYNVAPYAPAVASRMDARASQDELFWAPALDYLRVARHARTTASRSCPRPTTGRPTGCRAPASRSRGGGTASSTSPRTACSTATRSRRRGYRVWLRRMAVKYVLLPEIRLGKKGASREARLLARRRPRG